MSDEWNAIFFSFGIVINGVHDVGDDRNFGEIFQLFPVQFHTVHQSASMIIRRYR